MTAGGVTLKVTIADFTAFCCWWRKNTN